MKWLIEGYIVKVRGSIRLICQRMQYCCCFVSAARNLAHSTEVWNCRYDVTTSALLHLEKLLGTSYSWYIHKEI
jgi:hypothetical protein